MINFASFSSHGLQTGPPHPLDHLETWARSDQRERNGIKRSTYRKLFRVNFFAVPTSVVSQGEKLEVAVCEVRAVVRIKYENTWRWFRKRRGAVKPTRYGREAKFAGAEQCIVLDDMYEHESGNLKEK